MTNEGYCVEFKKKQNFDDSAVFIHCGRNNLKYESYWFSYTLTLLLTRCENECRFAVCTVELFFLVQ